MNKKGFTLVEMIVVIVLMGVIAVAAIPKVLKIMHAQSNDKYNTHIKLIESALDIYTVRYKGNFDNYPSADIYRIDYYTLINESLIVEDNIDCEGTIDLVKKKSNSYQYNYYLTCTEEGKNTPHVDKKNDAPACSSANNCVKIDD